MKGKLVWNSGMSFSGLTDSGFTVPMDASVDHGGANEGPRPMELILLGLGGCTAMDTISILQKKRQEVTDFEVQVHAGRATEHPKVITDAIIEYMVTGRNLDEAAIVRAIELSATRDCPAQAMFGKLMPIELKYHLYEDQGNGQRELVKSAVYTPAAQEA